MIVLFCGICGWVIWVSEDAEALCDAEPRPLDMKTNERDSGYQPHESTATARTAPSACPCVALHQLRMALHHHQ
jgi:hypothetical protein